MKTLLWLDDYRDPKKDQWLVFSPITTEDLEVYWVKSYKEFIEWIENNGLPTAICFDHDLGGDIIREIADDNFKTFKTTKNLKNEKTGYDAAKSLI